MGWRDYCLVRTVEGGIQMNPQQKAKLENVSKHLATIGKAMLGIGIVGLVVNSLSTTMLDSSLFPFDVGLAVMFGGVGILIIGAVIDQVFLAEPVQSVKPVQERAPQAEMGGGEYEIVIRVVPEA